MHSTVVNTQYIWFCMRNSTVIFYEINNIHEKVSQFWLVESNAINPKHCNFVLSQCKFLFQCIFLLSQCNFVLSQCIFLLSQCKFLLSHFGGEKTFTGKTNMAAKARQTQRTFRLNSKWTLPSDSCYFEVFEKLTRACFSKLLSKSCYFLSKKTSLYTVSNKQRM